MSQLVEKFDFFSTFLVKKCCACDTCVTLAVTAETVGMQGFEAPCDSVTLLSKN